jgi:hypothetical protein
MPPDRPPEYPVVLAERNGRFHLFVRELGVGVSDPSLERAYEKLKDARQRHLAALEDAGMLELLPPPTAQSAHPAAPARGARLGRFAGKAAVVAAAVMVVMLFAGWTLNAVVDSAVARLGMNQIGGREFWTGLEAAIHEAGDPDQDMPPEQRERLLESLTVIVERIRPFVETVQPLFPPRACVVTIEETDPGSLVEP